ncbi:hypothetical protein LTR28_000974, partial [Elasticomyces elasticus]
FSSNDTTEADLPLDEDVLSESSGCYVLAFIPKVKHADPALGWLAGTGRFDKNGTTGGVDLLFSHPVSDDDEHRKPTDLPYPRHVAFRFDAMGRLWLSARHNCIALDGIPLQRGEGRILQHQARIEIGQLRFLFQFIIPKEQEAVFRDALRDYLSSHRNVEAPHELTSATPSANDVNIGDWRLHGIVGATPLSIIEAASNMRTGEAVAVKRLLPGSTVTSTRQTLQLSPPGRHMPSSSTSVRPRSTKLLGILLKPAYVEPSGF